MKKFKILFMILLTLVFTNIRAEKTYTIETGQFEKLKINSNINLIYKNLPDSIGYARYTAEEGNADLFILTTKSNGTLRIQVNQTQWNNNNLPTLYVYSDFLNSVESSSDKTVLIENIAPCATFSANQIGNGSIIIDNLKCNNLTASLTTGNGSIILSGSCISAIYKMLGTGLISADRMAAENVKCSILGTGSIGCWPIDNLSVKGLGTTKIYYKGKPNIKKTGGGKLFELPEDDEYDRTGTEVKSFNMPVEEDMEDEDEEDDDDDEEDEYPDDENYKTIVTAKDR